jgi:hypothetical protein
MAEIRSIRFEAEALPPGAVPPRSVRVSAGVTLEGRGHSLSVDGEVEVPFDLGYLPTLIEQRIVAGIEHRIGRELFQDEQDLVRLAIERQVKTLYAPN